MALSVRLQQKQSQSLVMTPQLAQSIKLLQLGTQELHEFVHTEIEKNPLLELEPDQSSGDRRGSDADPYQKAREEAGANAETVTGELGVDAAKKEASLDTSFENVYDSGEVGPLSASVERQQVKSAATGSGSSTNSESLDAIALAGEKLTFSQHLEEQIGLTFKQPENRKIATYIAHGLDEDGYFREDLSEAAKNAGACERQFQQVLTKFQTLEPTGVAARNLAQCLELQLTERNRFDPAMAALIGNLDLLARREFAKLMKLCAVSREDFADMVQEIRALDPRPAAQYEAVLSETVVADVIVSQKPDGNWAIELSPETLPKVLINHDYYAELKNAIDTDEGTNFVTDCMQNASWLVKSLDQRAQTVLKVATEIVRQQDMFFAHGVEHMRPMNLKTVAEAIKMHESTVSRVTSNKYLRCQQGIFELKFFFSSSIKGADEDGAGHSSEAVKLKIKQMVDGENPKKILSDDQIVKLLQETGIAVARRTVAKYREALRIPSSVQRRRDKFDLAG